MGGYHSTFCVKKDERDVAKFCCFENKTCAQGCRWNVHKGRLQPTNSSQLKKVVVKVCPDPSCSHDECQAEIHKMNLADTVLKECPELKNFRICTTYKSEVDEACMVFSIFSSSRNGAVIQEGTPVLIQDRVDGPIRTFFDFDEEPSTAAKFRSCFLDLAVASYRVSGGQRVISGVKGLVISRRENPPYHDAGSNGSGYRKYLLTSLTVHSSTKEFGSKDRGLEGIQAFLKTLETAGLPVPSVGGDRMKRTPSAPPVEEDEDDILTLEDEVAGEGLTHEQKLLSEQRISPTQQVFTEQQFPPQVLQPGKVKTQMSGSLCDQAFLMPPDFGQPPAYESVVLGMGWGRSDLPPSYSETCNESEFLLGLASYALASDVFPDAQISSVFLERSRAKN